MVLTDPFKQNMLGSKFGSSSPQGFWMKTMKTCIQKLFETTTQKDLLASFDVFLLFRDSQLTAMNLISLNGSKIVNPSKSTKQDSKYVVVHTFHPHPLLCSVHSDSICTSGKNRRNSCGFQRPELKENTKAPTLKVFASLNHDKELGMVHQFVPSKMQKNREKKNKHTYVTCCWINMSPSKNASFFTKNWHLVFLKAVGRRVPKQTPPNAQIHKAQASGFRFQFHTT